jgi:hypothetical protein
MYLDGKIGAHHGAEPAAGALVVVCHLRRAISFCVQLAADRKNLLGAEGDAQAASFAALGIQERFRSIHDFIRGFPPHGAGTI